MRIGLIGAGAVAPLHARAADLISSVTLSAVCDLVLSAAAQVASESGAAVFTDHRELMDSGAIDAVIVNTPHALHKEMVLDAAARGLHVLVEKPLATTVEDCDEMVEACTAAGVTLVVGHIQHFLPDKRAVAAVLASGELGAVRMVHDYRSTDYRPGARSPWFFSPVMAGGGALMNVGAHCLDRSVWLSGSPARSLSATTLARFDVAVETDALVSLRHADTSTSISVLSDVPHQVDEVSVVCERGVLVADPRRGAYQRRNGHTTTLHEPTPDDIPKAFHRQLADFVATISGRPPAVSLAHSRHVVELVLAAYRSSRRDGTPVLLEPAVSAHGVDALR
jgi:predicted dehydrogenase